MVKLDRAIRVLIVDDSIVAREILKEMISGCSDINVVGEASNGADAVEKTKLLCPDIVTMDVKMPVMDGLEAVKAIMAANPTPILIVTASLSVEETDVSFQAIADGALDVMVKPHIESEASRTAFRKEFIEKIRILSRVKVISHFGRKPRRTRSIPKTGVKAREKVVAIGASTGGPEAIMRILKALPDNFPSPIAVVQHITAGFDKGFASWMDNQVGLAVKLAEEGEHLKPGVVLIAPSNYHLAFNGIQAGLDDSPPVNSCKPSVDVLFESLARGFKENTVGVILSGIGNDGTRGAKAIKHYGGLTIAQDRESSVVYGMPGSAVEEGVVDFVLPLEAIPEMLVSVVTEKKK